MFKDKKILVKLIGGTVLAMLTIGTTYWLANSQSPERGIASKPTLLQVTPEKAKMWSKLHDHANEVPVTGKRYSTIGLEILANTKESAERGRPFSLRGIVTPKEDMENIKIKWVLPSQVQLVSGQLENNLESLAQGESQEFEITVISNSDENQQIHFTAYQSVSGEEVGNVVQYNTILQPIVNSKDKLQKAQLDGNKEAVEKAYVE